MSAAASLRAFATAALSRAGAVVEWAEDEPAGEALLPPRVAQALGCGEHVRIAGSGAEGELRLDFASEALERLQVLAESGPWSAAGRVADRAARKLDAAALVERSIDIPNARVRLTGAAPAQAEYHVWHLAVQVMGEESWEDLVTVSMNAGSHRAVGLAVPGAHELVPWSPPHQAADTRATAVTACAALAQERAAAFVARMAARRERDRKRLRDYYGALLATTPRGARAALATPIEERQARRAAVDQELVRKLDEVDERSRLRVRVQPVTLLRLEVPVWILDIVVQRRTALATVRATWNHRCGGLEPLACAVCGATAARFLARDADAALLCGRCSGK
jgi:hypothetical protein